MREPMIMKPAVGDTIYYVGEGHAHLTKGGGYEVIEIDEDGDVVIFDDDGDREYIHPNFYVSFEVEEGMPKDPGVILLDEEATYEIVPGDRFEVTLWVDSQGYDTLKRLAAHHKKATRAAQIMKQIAELQQELKEI